jgi:protein-S-isoprenylcysteine O-methyltransferase Ste14
MVSPDVGEEARQAKNHFLAPAVFNTALIMSIGVQSLEFLMPNMNNDELFAVFKNSFGSTLPVESDPAWLQQYTVRALVGANLMLGAQLVKSSANRTLDTAWDSGTFASTGLYRYSRNPFYVGDRMWVLGAACIAPSLVVLGIGAAVFAGTALAARGEERDMTEEHGEAYAKYKRRTPRFVLF